MIGGPSAQADSGRLVCKMQHGFGAPLPSEEDRQETSLSVAFRITSFMGMGMEALPSTSVMRSIVV